MLYSFLSLDAFDMMFHTTVFHGQDRSSCAVSSTFSKSLEAVTIPSYRTIVSTIYSTSLLLGSRKTCIMLSMKCVYAFGLTAARTD